MSQRIRISFAVAFCLLLAILLVFAQSDTQATIATVTEIKEVTITESGFEPSEISIEEGDEVVWRNSTAQTVTLSSEPLTILLLPLLEKAGSQQSAKSTERTVQPNAIHLDTFTQVLAPGATFRHVFVSPGEYQINLLEFVNLHGLIHVFRRARLQVHGFVVANVRNEEKKGDFYLPDARVYLKDQGTGLAGPTVSTDLHGWYLLPNHAPGTYDLCAEASGFPTFCSPTPIVLTTESVSPGYHLPLTPAQGYLQGRVLMKNGKPCFHENSYFETLQTTTVSLLDAGANVVAGPVNANDLGYYVLPNLPGPGAFQLKAQCAGASTTQMITLTPNNINGSPDFNLILDNFSPQISLVTPKLGSNVVRHAAPGDTLQVNVDAVDPDGTALHYEWGDGIPGFVSVDAPSIMWELPATPGMNILYVQVTDGRGGFAVDKVMVNTQNSDVVFAGHVVDDLTDAPIMSATVVISDRMTTSNSDGYFQIVVPEANRYVLNAHKIGYALLSQPYYTGATELVLRLHAAQRQVCDPGKRCIAIYEGQKSFAQVFIEPNTLVNADGEVATTTLNIDVHAYDLSLPNPMPGDGAAFNNDGEAVTMNPFAATSVEVTDAAGERYNLAPGKTARMHMRVSAAQLAAGTPPATIPLWEYNEQTGFWEEKSQATYNAGSLQYEGDVPSFSEWNADTVFTNVACLKFTIDEQSAPPYPFSIRATLPPPFVVAHNDFVVTEKKNAIFRLPPNQPITFTIQVGTGPDAITYNHAFNTGPAIAQEFQEDPYNGFPPFDWSACLGFDPTSAPTPNGPAIVRMEAPTHSIPYLSRRGGPGSLPEAVEYYNTNAGVTMNSTGTTCSGAKCTLVGWKAANGFDTGADTVAYYYNAGDLGLGREMHCKRHPVNTNNIACYVTNYGRNFPPAADPVTAISDAINHNNPIATVAMEYVPGSTSGVKFYVYFHSSAGDNLAPQAVLDSENFKNVPHLCMNCHGGTYDATNNVANGSAFLPFDITSFKYDQVEGYSLANQQASFRSLNSLVLATNPNSANANDPIGALINLMYPCGVNNSGCTSPYNPTTPIAAPADWAAKPALYQTIVGPYCRTCHISLDSAKDWTKATQFLNAFSDTPPGFRTLINSAVCTTAAHYMPHAEKTYKNFWFSTNPRGPSYLADSGTGLNFTAGCVP